MNPDKTKIRSILFVTLSNLGDIILTTPVLEKLQDEFPDAVIDVITSQTGREIFIEHPAVREVHVYKKREEVGRRMKHLMSLRQKKYDLAVDLKNSLIPYMIGARFKTGIFNSQSLKQLFSLQKRAPRHKKEEHLFRLAGLGINTSTDTRFFLPVSDDDRRRVDELMRLPGSVKTVIINPGAKSHLKRWDAAKFANLADRLIKELGCEVFICGNADDTETVKMVTLKVHERVTDLCCKTSIGALAELMKRADLVITNDSAPLHMASAVNAPTIAIFGPSDEKKYGPLAEKNRVVKPDVPCRPCEKALCAVGPDEGCISQINVEEVFEAAKELLNV
jgi:lipopolysaccharide heptosyltransferase II